MPRLPTARDLGRGPNLRIGRSSAPAVGVAAAEGLGNLGAGIVQGAQVFEKRANDAEAFDTRAAFVAFEDAQRERLTELQKNAPAGASGFRQGYSTELKTAAGEFWKTLPKRLQPEYQVRLLDMEGRLGQQAQAFEDKAAGVHARNQLDGIADRAASRIDANAGEYDRALAEMVGAIRENPHIPATDKEELVRKAQQRFAEVREKSKLTRDPVYAGNVATVIPSTYDADIQAAAAKHGTSADLVKRIAWRESRFAQDVMTGKRRSTAGAEGMMQFMPDTRARYQHNPADYRASLDAGAKHIADLMKQYGGDEELVAIAYNAGPGVADRFKKTGRDRSTLPEETKGYLNEVIGGTSGRPRLDDLSFEGRQRVIDFAEREQRRFAAERNAEAAQANGALDLRIATGAVLDPREIIEAPISDAMKADRLRQWESKHKEALKELEVLKEFQLGRAGGGGPRKTYNSYDKDDREKGEVIHRRFYQGASPMGDEKAQGLFAEFYKETGIVPKSVIGEMRQAADSNDPATIEKLGAAIARIQQTNPSAFEGEPGADKLDKLGDQYRAYTDGMFMEGSEAAKRIVQTRTPEYKKQAEANKVLLEGEKGKPGLVDKISMDDVRRSLGSGVISQLFGDAASEGFNAGTDALAVSKYKELYREHFNLLGDDAAARAAADKSMARLYGSSAVTGKRQFMEFPPERYYPAIGGNHNYIGEELLAAVNKQVPGGKAKREDIVLKPHPGTAAEARLGPRKEKNLDGEEVVAMGPSYTVHFKYKKDGVTVMDSLPGHFVVTDKDMKAAKDKQAAKEKQDFDDLRVARENARKEIEAQKQFERGGQPTQVPQPLAGSNARQLRTEKRTREAEAAEVEALNEPTFDPKGDGYDYAFAARAGFKPDKDGHWPSRAPLPDEEARELGLPLNSGLILKGRDHETWSKTMQREHKLGFKIIEYRGRFYSIPKRSNVPRGGRETRL